MVDVMREKSQWKQEKQKESKPIAPNRDTRYIVYVIILYTKTCARSAIDCFEWVILYDIWFLLSAAALRHTIKLKYEIVLDRIIIKPHSHTHTPNNNKNKRKNY